MLTLDGDIDICLTGHFPCEDFCLAPHLATKFGLKVRLQLVHCNLLKQSTIPFSDLKLTDYVDAKNNNNLNTRKQKTHIKFV